MTWRILLFCCIFSCSALVSAVENPPFMRPVEPSIPAYLLRKPEVYNPFKGMFQNWENRKTVRESINERVNTYMAELTQFYPKSNPEDIQLFMKWYYFGSKNLNIPKPEPGVSSNSWREAARIVKLFYAGKNYEARNALRKLIRKLPSGDLLRYELIKLEQGCYKKSQPEYKHYEQMMVENIENTVLSGKYINSPVYTWLYSSLSASSHCGSRYWGRFEQKLKPLADKIDPWFREMIQGRAAIAWAWESRGDGWGSTVSEDGWDGFGKNLEKARKHFYKAIELFPDRVSAHIQLITVEMGFGSEKEMIKVFKELVRHDPTNNSGWNKLLWGLLPRWCGSLDLIKMLAIEALDCPRRDSKVQYCGYQALAYIAKYHGNYRWQRVYMDADVFDRSERLFKEYSESLTDAAARRRFLRDKVCRHLALLEYDKALAAVNERGGTDTMKNWWHWGFAPSTTPVGSAVFDDPAMRLTVFTGKYGNQLQKAEKLFVSGQNDGVALVELANVIIKDDLTAQEKDYLIDLYGRWRLNCSPEEFLGENGKYKSAYVVAGQYNRSDVAAEMVKLGYNITANENFPGESVYNIASEGENIEGLKKLHASGAKLTLPSPKTGHTPIHVAARHGNAGMVKALLELGVPVELKDRNGHTALHIAATKKYPAVIELLFANGADPNMGDNEDDFCLIYLPQVRAPYNIYKLFTDHPQINVNKQNHAGVSALHYMAKFNTPTAVWELMFSKGADINIRDRDGKTPLDMAEAGGHTELVEYLVAKGAKRGSKFAPVRQIIVSGTSEWFDDDLIRLCGVIALPVLVIVLLLLRLRNRKKDAAANKLEKYNPGSANFESHYLQVTPEYIRVKPTKKLFLFYFIFTGMGAVGMIFSYIAELQGAPSQIIIMKVACFVFSLLGIVLTVTAYRRRLPYIDLRQRMFYPVGIKAGEPPEAVPGLPLSDAQKLDISYEVIQGSKSSHTSYTFSIVYPGNEKYILLRHGSEKAIIRDAKLISQHTGLSVPEKIVHEESTANEKSSALFMLIFGLIWTTFSISMLLFVRQKAGDELMPLFFSGVFVLVGVVISAIGIIKLIKNSNTCK